MQTSETQTSYVPQPQNLDDPEDNPDSSGIPPIANPPVNTELQKKFTEYFENKKRKIQEDIRNNPSRVFSISPSLELKPGPVGPAGLQVDEEFLKTMRRPRVPANIVPVVSDPPVPEWVKPLVVVVGGAFGLLLGIIVKFGISGLYEYLFKSDPETTSVISEAELNTPD